MHIMFISFEWGERWIIYELSDQNNERKSIKINGREHRDVT